jgi:hypothetical protein
MKIIERVVLAGLLAGCAARHDAFGRQGELRNRPCRTCRRACAAALTKNRASRQRVHRRMIAADGSVRAVTASNPKQDWRSAPVPVPMSMSRRILTAADHVDVEQLHATVECVADME